MTKGSRKKSYFLYYSAIKGGGGGVKGNCHSEINNFFWGTFFSSDCSKKVPIVIKLEWGGVRP